MIPRVIHYIWLSDEPINRNAKICIRSWKHCAPGWTIHRWHMKDFDFEAMPLFVRQAIEKRKWAFACDYLRLYVLEREGGFYLDSDVLMLRSPEKYRHHRFVSSVEYYEKLFEPVKKLVDEDGNARADMVPGMAIQAAIMGSEAHHPLLKACMSYYESRPFIREDGSLSNELLAPHVYALQARPFGFRYQNQLQRLQDGIILYPSNEFAPAMWESTHTSRMIHLCAGSWREMPEKFKKHYDHSLRLAVRKRQIRIHILNRNEAKHNCE